MKDLTTRKIVLGLLMVLVLAFSVQGIAIALTLTKGTGDFQNASMTLMFQPFTITFTPGLTSTEVAGKARTRRQFGLYNGQGNRYRC